MLEIDKELVACLKKAQLLWPLASKDICLWGNNQCMCFYAILAQNTYFKTTVNEGHI